MQADDAASLPTISAGQVMRHDKALMHQGALVLPRTVLVTGLCPGAGCLQQTAYGCPAPAPAAKLPCAAQGSHFKSCISAAMTGDVKLHSLGAEAMRLLPAQSMRCSS